MIEIALGASNIYRLVRVHIHEEEENPFRGIKVVKLRVWSDDVSYSWAVFDKFDGTRF